MLVVPATDALKCTVAGSAMVCPAGEIDTETGAMVIVARFATGLPACVVAVTVTGDRFTVKWTSPTSIPGPAIITQGAIWSVSTESGVLEAVSPATGNRIFSKQIGAVPSRFIAPAAGGGLVVVAAGRTVMAFGD